MKVKKLVGIILTPATVFAHTFFDDYNSSMELPRELIRLLSTSKNIAVLTGAGVSQESGLRTFRDAQTGLWAQYKPHELASPEAFQRDPKLVWDWYAWRREAIKGGPSKCRTLRPG